jgi:hypothetical protein
MGHMEKPEEQDDAQASTQIVTSAVVSDSEVRREERYPRGRSMSVTVLFSFGRWRVQSVDLFKSLQCLVIPWHPFILLSKHIIYI